jgi:hypothetical protein
MAVPWRFHRSQRACAERRYGKLIWHHETGETVSVSPSVEDGVADVGFRDLNVYALEVDLWCGGERDQA